ncbi:MAG: restriction endonuclease [Betaproteobacteria bacterium]|nr:restriction endonuclease [Betaproteobacteria bacterium]
MNIPNREQLMISTLKALETLGGSGSIEEIANTVIQALNLPESITSQLHNPEKSSCTEVEYRLYWARTYLKNYGWLDNSERGVWALTPKYQLGQKIDIDSIVQSVRSKSSSRTKKKQTNQSVEEDILPSFAEEIEAGWKKTLHQKLLQMKPDAFERLAKRFLRESGFVQMEVTGCSGDGGIDGKGIIKLQNVLSYHVVLQCKRYKESVGAGAIRDFRGAMIGRADKGLFITTSTFTRDAIREATRDGASPIDLIDGERLMEMLKQLRLGVHVRMVEEVGVDDAWFESI